MIPGDTDGGMTVVVGGQKPLAGGFAAVVNFFQDPVPHLAQERVGVLGWRGDAQHPA